MTSTSPATRLVLTAIPDSWSWMKRDLLIRLAPFAAVSIAVELALHPPWIGFGAGDAGAQLAFGLVGAPVLLVAACWVQLLLTRGRGVLSVPKGPGDAWFQAAYYVLNAPVEEAFFRGVVQGGISALTVPVLGFAVGTAAYVLYHRLGWSWPDTLATALLGLPLGLAFWLLPGPPSLLGVTIAHVGATCGFLGLGPFVLRKLRLV